LNSLDSSALLPESIKFQVTAGVETVLAFEPGPLDPGSDVAAEAEAHLQEALHIVKLPKD